MDDEFKRLYRTHLIRERDVSFELEKHTKQKLLIIRIKYVNPTGYNYVYLDWPYE